MILGTLQIIRYRDALHASEQGESYSSCTWAGGALKKLTAFADAVKWEVVSNPVDNKQGVSADDYQQAFDLGKAMAQKLLQ